MIWLFGGFAILEYIIYFRHNPHFFQGDTIFWFYRRHRTISDFLMSFFKLDPGWYRPLTDKTIQSLFYPVFGFEPAGYRVVQYLLFMSVIFAMYELAFIVSRSKRVAVIASLLFGVHTVNAYTTYDVAFVPELSFTFFYVCAAGAYLRYRDSHGRRFFFSSIACFVASLCSKESAVTLPVMVVALDLILNRAALRDAIAAARAHLIILGLYIVLVVGYLGVQRPAFRAILDRPGPEVAYRLAVDRTILINADYGLSWAFNIPRGWQTESRHMDPWAITFLKFFRAAVVLLGLWLMFRPERRIVIAALAWFFIAILPALPVFEHFVPYYLFCPLVGLSIGIAATADAAYGKIAKYSPAGAALALIAPLALLAGICAIAARNDAQDNRMLGWSSRLASNSLSALKAKYPVLPSNTTIYFSNAAEPGLSWDTSDGELFKIAYGDESIRTLYWDWGVVITKELLERGPLIVMEYDQFHFTDVTEEFLAASEPPVGYQVRPDYRLAITPAAAESGEKYRLSIAGLENSDVTLHYTVDGSPVRAITAHFDDHHQASFETSDETGKGLYKFVGFRKAGTEDWIQAAASIRIN